MRRTHQAVKAYKENVLFAAKRSSNGIPPTASIILDSRSCRIPIVKPIFKTKEVLMSDSSGKIFVEMSPQDKEWLNTFATDIVGHGHMEQYPFFNSSLDVIMPGISAYRISAPKGFCQVQVRQIPDHPTLFQLDYFEVTKGEILLKLIGLCNLINYEHPVVDVVYSTFYENDTAKEYGSVVATTFQDVLVYMRPWDYSCGAKYVKIEPITFPCWH